MIQMKEVSEGEKISIDGVTYRIGENSAESINLWLKCFEMGITDEMVEIDLFRDDGQGRNSFPPSKIKEALEKADFNKTRHGL